MPIYVNDGGVEKEIVSIYSNDGGVAKLVGEVWVRSGGVAKYAHRAELVPPAPPAPLVSITGGDDLRVIWVPPLDAYPPVTSYSVMTFRNGTLLATQIGAASPHEIINRLAGVWTAQVAATNSVGTGPFSPVSNSATLFATVPDPPSIRFTAIPGGYSYAAIEPDNRGGSALTGWSDQYQTRRNSGEPWGSGESGTGSTVAFSETSSILAPQVRVRARAHNATGASAYSAWFVA